MTDEIRNLISETLISGIIVILAAVVLLTTVKLCKGIHNG